MFVCLIQVELRLFAVHSLKEKRSIMKRLIEKTRHKFAVTIAEVGEQDLWQRGQIGIALVSNEQRYLQNQMEKIISFLEEDNQVEIIGINHEITPF